MIVAENTKCNCSVFVQWVTVRRKLAVKKVVSLLNETTADKNIAELLSTTNEESNAAEKVSKSRGSKEL